MIIDEILDAKYNNNIIDIDYIKEQADFFEFDYITKAIQTQDPEETRKALALYIKLNGYNTDIIENELQNIIIKFEETKTAETIKQIKSIIKELKAEIMASYTEYTANKQNKNIFDIMQGV